MKLEQQVVSLELAKKMKELGALQESLFWWNVAVKDDMSLYIKDGHGKVYYFSDDNSELERLSDAHETDFVSAYTVAELGEMLPARVTVENPRIPDFDGTYHAALESRKHSSWEIVYIIYREGIGYILNGYENGARFHADTEADARAKMWIYLKENNLI